MAQPKDNNNPFAIIQMVPSPWQGLTGKRSNGFLTFKDTYSGVRAGFINIINTYLNRGLNTIEKILPVYAPAGHGGNDPKAYIKLVQKFSGLKPNEVISTQDQLYRLGTAIVQVEEGVYQNTKDFIGWVRRADFDKGFQAATAGRNFAKKVTAAGSGLVVIGILALIIFNLK